MDALSHIFSFFASTDFSSSSSSSSLSPPYDADVIIVGGGLSGLTSAHYLTKEGVSVLILEATDTLGGRTRSIPLPTGELVSVGGSWAMLDDRSILHLAKEVNCLPFIPKIQLQSNPRMILHPYLLLKLWLLGRRFSKDNPTYWTSYGAEKYDKISLQEWLDSQTGVLDTEEAKKAVRDWFVIMESIYLDLSKISTLFAATFLYQRLSNITSTGFLIPNIYRWEGGTGIFISSLVQAICETIRGHEEILIDLVSTERSGLLPFKGKRIFFFY